MSTTIQEVDVAIVGCGPVGALMGNLLGRRGLRTTIFEREHTSHGVPRAFSCDDEALRIYQQAGLAGALLPDMTQCPQADFVGPDGLTLATIRFQGLDFGSGYHALNFFHQPALEAVLRAGLARLEGVRLDLGHEVEALREDGSGVTLGVRDRQSGAVADVRARYVLGCDGRRSATRRLIGVELTGSRYAEPWLAVSAIVPDPPPSMPDARFVCDPFRPGFVARGAMGQCRWEFMIRPDEDLTAMERPENFARLLAPYVDPGAITITRASVYTFENKVAARWRSGRTFLLGDAAHTMPPFMGQGLVSGLRDAANLAWKLDLVLRGAAGDSLLDTYEMERRRHTQAMSEISVRLGHVFLARNARVVWLRDRALRALDRVPRVRRFVRDMEFKPLPTHEAGFMRGGRRKRGAPEGTLFPQPLVSSPGRERARLDDALGPGFAVLGLGHDPRRLFPPRFDLLWHDTQTRFFRILPPGEPAGEGDLIDCEGKLDAWFSQRRATIALLRPDHFVFGAGAAGDAESLASELRDALRR
jgi:3-(3-hydroxy-phenyl)propionate hydroxylase